MDAYSKAFAATVRDQVTTAIAVEANAQVPQGLTNRSFEAIVGQLMLANWDRLAAGPGTVGQIVARMCGTEKAPPVYRPEGARTWRTASRGRRRAR
jgi:hypothetical protein